MRGEIYGKAKSFVKNYRWAILCFLITFAVYVLCDRLSADGGGAGDIGEQLNGIGENQSAITERIGIVREGVSGIEKELRNSEEAIGNAAKRADNLEDGITESRDLIDRCQRLIGEIRCRGESD